MDLIANPERFTGYAGPSAAKVWDAIYNENCFNVAQRMQLASDCEQCSLDRESEAEELNELLQNAASTGFSLAQSPAVIPLVPSDSAHAYEHHHPGEKSKSSTNADFSKATDPVNPLVAGSASDDEICLEKRVFYRMISGLHASISIHICDEYLNQSTGVWVSLSIIAVFVSLCHSVNVLIAHCCPFFLSVRDQTWSASSLAWELTRIAWRTSTLTMPF